MSAFRGWQMPHNPSEYSESSKASASVGRLLSYFFFRFILHTKQRHFIKLKAIFLKKLTNRSGEIASLFASFSGMKILLPIFLCKSYNIFQLRILVNIKWIQKTNMPEHIQETNKFIILKHNILRDMCNVHVLSITKLVIICYLFFSKTVYLWLVILISVCAEPSATISV